MIKAVKENKFLCLIWLVCSALTVLSVVKSTVFSAFILIIYAIYALVRKPADSFVLLISLAPFASLIKLAPGTTSLFTLCEIIYVLISCIKKRINNMSSALLIAILAVFMAISTINNLDILSIVKVAFSLFVVYYASADIRKKDVTNTALLLALGALIMLICTNVDGFVVKLTPYYEEINYYLTSSGELLFRNSGFFVDPNYFSMFLIIVLTLLSVMYYYKQIGASFWVLVLLIIPMGMFTYSKSYFLAIALLLLACFIFVIIPRHKAMSITVLLVGTVGIFLILAIPEIRDAVSAILERLLSGDITTGRTDINIDYINYIFSDIKVTLFGEGIAVEKFDGAANNVHNIYIEILFKLGFVGGVLYLVTLASALKRRTRVKKKVVNCIPVLFVLLMYFFLAGVCDHFLPFYVMISYMAYHYEALPEE